MLKYKLRKEAADKIDSKCMMKPEDIDAVRRANFIVGSAVHPDTNEIIPIYCRMSGFVVFNVPLVFSVLFVRNQTPAFNAAM